MPENLKPMSSTMLRNRKNKHQAAYSAGKAKVKLPFMPRLKPNFCITSINLSAELVYVLRPLFKVKIHVHLPSKKIEVKLRTLIVVQSNS